MTINDFENEFELNESYEGEEDYTSELESFKIEKVSDIDVLFMDEAALQEFFKYKKGYVGSGANRQDVLNFVYSEFDKRINSSKYSDYEYAIMKNNDIKNRGKFLNGQMDATSIYIINLNTYGSTQRSTSVDSNGNVVISNRNTGVDQETQKALNILNKIMYEVNAKLLQEYGSYTKKGKIFNRNGTEVPYFILNVHFGEILLFENKKKVKIDKKTGEIVE